MSDIESLQLRIVRSHGGSKNIVMPVPDEGCGLADALELGGERLNDAQWRSANQCRIERFGAGWQVCNGSRTLVCVLNGRRVSADGAVALTAGDALELGLLRIEVETATAAVLDASSMALSAAHAERLSPDTMRGLAYPHSESHAHAVPASASVADAVEFDLRDLTDQPAWFGALDSLHADSLDNPFGVLGIAGAEPRPASDSLAEMLGQSPAQSANAARAPVAAIGSRPDTAALLMSGLHDEFVRVVRDPHQLAGQADWDGVLATHSDKAPTLDELSQRAAPYALLRDILLEREGIDQIIENFDPLTPSTLLDTTAIDDVLHLFAPDLARSAKVAVPTLTRREHHEVSPDSHMQPGRLPQDTP